MRLKPTFKVAFASLLLLCAATAGRAQNYCTPNPGIEGCDFGIDINNFTLYGENGTVIDDENTYCSGPSAYDVRTNESVDMTTGTTYTATIAPEEDYDENDIAIWIDFNDNGTFEPSELVGTYTYIVQSGSPVDIAIPAGANPGTHRMRVMDGGYTDPMQMDPCNDPNGNYWWLFGETNDYSVNIFSNIACTGTPNVGTLNANQASVCPNITNTFSLTGGDPLQAGFSFIFESSPAGLNTWTTLIGPVLSNTYIVNSQAVNTDYRATLTCTNSGLSSVSNVVTVNMNTPAFCPCIPYAGDYGCSQDDEVNDFIVSGENATTINDVGTGCIGGTAYDSRLGESIDVFPGNTYSANISTGYSGSGPDDQDNAAIWIDFDGSGTFEPSELVGQMDAVDIFDQAISINIPAGTAYGSYVMRVMVGYDVEPGDMDPCNVQGGFNTWDYGEVHDYTVNVVSPCAAPTGLTATNITQTGATISWTGTAAGYEYVTDQIPADPIGAGTATVATTYNASGLTPATLYYAHVRSNCNGVYSAWVTDTFTTAAIPPICNPVTGLTSGSITAFAAAINWTAVNGATGYEYVTDQVATDPAGAGTATANTNYNATGLNAGTMYYAHVRTNCGAGNFSTWTSYSFTTLLDNTGVGNVNGGQFDVSVFPNPAKDVITVQLEGTAAANGKIILTDVAGKEIEQIKTNNSKTVINIHDLAAGMYLIKYKDDAHTQMLRISKQ